MTWSEILLPVSGDGPEAAHVHLSRRSPHRVVIVDREDHERSSIVS